MKGLKKVLIGAFALVFALMPMSACTRAVGEKIDSTKSQLYVANHYAGLRDFWTQAVVDRFTEAYKDVSFEEGKKGVQVFIENGSYNGFQYMDQLVSDSNEVFFIENVMYYDFVARDLFLDITDVVTEPLVDCSAEADIFSETRSIEDKLAGMDNGIREFYRTDDNKYYALPFYEAYHCISYDIDLFEEKGFYFAKGGCPSEYSAFTQNHNENKASGKFTSYKYVGDMGDRSAGPDGLYGTEDDGLPATYAEFFVLCEKMSSSNVRPITFYGNSDYLNGTATALWTDYEGKDKMRSNFTFEGKDMDIVTSFDEDKPVVTKTDITPENAYLLYNQEGRYYALDFLHTLIEKEYYDGDAFMETHDHVCTQTDYLYGRFSPAKRRIAMVAEGTWWQNEAKQIFDTLTEEYGAQASANNRRFGVLPFPKADESKIGEEQTYLLTKQTACFINKTIAPEKIKLAKEFVKFCHTDESLVEFMQIANMPKPFQFDMSEKQLEKCTSYGRDIYAAHNSGNVVFSASKSPVYRYTPQKFMEVNAWNSVLNNGYPASAISTTYKNNKSVTAREYFDGLLKGDHTQTKWQEQYAGHFH